MRQKWQSEAVCGEESGLYGLLKEKPLDLRGFFLILERLLDGVSLGAVHHRCITPTASGLALAPKVARITSWNRVVEPRLRPAAAGAGSSERRLLAGGDPSCAR